MVLCNWYLSHAALGDTLDCFLGTSHKCVLINKTRNIHISSFISTLNKIKSIIGIYPIISSTNRNWSHFQTGYNSQGVLEILPAKKVILPAIKYNLNDLWLKEWTLSKGPCQTKFWFTKPDPFLASRLINMSRADLGRCIQFFTGHGWWQKHLQFAKLSDNPQCRLCEEDGCKETPIHIFTECVSLANTRLALFGV